MKVTVADTAGFCMGVSRAVKIARNTARETTGKVYTLGELIHNKEVVAELEELGVWVTEELPVAGTVVIRAHGVPPQCLQSLAARGVPVVDATCPHVLASQKVIAGYAKDGATVVILGDSRHPEVIGLCGYARGRVEVIATIADIKRLNLPGEFLFIAQTTFSKDLFAQIAAYLKENYPGCRVVDSICDATQKRQDEARELARSSEVLVVVGGKHSANTLRLAEIGVAEGSRVVHIEGVSELEAADFAGCAAVGVTAGASTPVSAVEKVVSFLAGIAGSEAE